MKRVFCLFIAVVLFAMLVPVTALAANKVEPLTYNKWYRLTDGRDNVVYKVRIKSDTVLTVQWKNYNEDKGFAYGSFYTDKGCKEELDLMHATFLGVDEPKQGRQYFVLYPGTYYIKMYDETEKTQIKVSSKAVNTINKPNYCLSQAITLKANRKANYAQTYKNNYHRWYKIKLTKRQAIKFYCEYKSILRIQYDLYDSNFNEIRTSYTDYGFKTDGVQSTGTYYLVIQNYMSELLTMGRYCSFFWK